MMLLSETFKQYMIFDLQNYNNCYYFQRRWKSKYNEVFRIILIIQVLQANVMSFEISRFRVLKSLLARFWSYSNLYRFKLSKMRTWNLKSKSIWPKYCHPNEPLSHVHTNISCYKILTLILFSHCLILCCICFSTKHFFFNFFINFQVFGSIENVGQTKMFWFSQKNKVCGS